MLKASLYEEEQDNKPYCNTQMTQTILIRRDEENLWNVYNLLQQFLSVKGLKIDQDNILEIQKMSKETRLDKTFQLEMGKGWEPIMLEVPFGLNLYIKQVDKFLLAKIRKKI